ncbi:hypothetical protein BDV96DRAFT_639772 [Lophiotrema nucula]|uniref:Uncharacterized protein n=1 Tax=Lophiotrema nucula TaxID=690887 RepID=A0A6A5ZWG3_9PLEO|nr:hypothetical protein BDV96DRAFT_639772 [Lophiotrema nucula]
MASTRTHTLLEAIIFILATIELGLIITYIVLQYRAGAAALLGKPGYEPDLKHYHEIKGAIIAFYALPPVATMLLAATGMILPRFKSLPRLYAIITTPILAACWATVTILWGDCHGQRLVLNQAWDVGEFCFLNYLDVDGDRNREEYGSVRGVPTGLFGVIIAVACLLFFAYIYYIWVAVRDYRRDRIARRK